MRFTLTIESDNAAMVDAPQAEVSRILGEVACLVYEGDCYAGTVRDSNGNRVGRWALKVGEEGC